MGEYSAIEWTHHTFNPWWGCTKVSAGCTNCYAETWAKRYGHQVWGPRQARRTFSDQHWQTPLKWNRQALARGERMRVFCASMADVFEDHPQIAFERQRLWRLIEATPALDWLLLTKRPEHMRQFAPWLDQWPLNIWAMTSVEDQAAAAERVPLLLDVPAAVHALSVEPLLGPLDLEPWLERLAWVIVGGESGSAARPLDPAWVRRLRDQCQEAQVAFFFKQWGAWAPVADPQGEGEMRRMGKKRAGRLLDGREWNELPAALQLAEVCG